VLRDLLLGIPITRDIDLAVEGDVGRLAPALAAALGGRVTAQHEAFGTATVICEPPGTAGPSLTLDLARTRTEHYPYPAALPVVQPATLPEDLARRDFTINAMALDMHTQEGQLTGARLLDPFGGQHDLQSGLLRVLHPLSLQDDPTRMLRGLRLAARLGLRLEPHTSTLLASALAQHHMEATSPDRIRAELCLALEEPDPVAVLRQAHAWGLLPHIFEPLEYAQEHLPPFDVAAHPEPLVRAGVLTYALDMSSREDLIARYRLPNESARMLRDVGRLRSLLADLETPDLPNSQLDRLLRPFSIPALDVVRYVHTDTRIYERITHYVAVLRDIHPLLNGHALQRMGVPAGPRLGALLAGLRAARLDDQVTTRADEEAWVQRQLASKP
jgi:tRNA nucleotidyltransferase (CCA-adding enzyme)